jgi:hypothetical protein
MCCQASCIWYRSRQVPVTCCSIIGDVDAGGVRIAAHLEDAFGVQIELLEMQPALALALGTPLQSRKGLDRLGKRAGDIGRWLCTEQAQALEQEELDPQSPHQPLQRPPEAAPLLRKTAMEPPAR